MRFTKTIVSITLFVLLISFAVPAQKSKGSAAKPRKPVAVVSPIDNEALKESL